MVSFLGGYCKARHVEVIGASGTEAILTSGGIPVAFRVHRALKVVGFERLATQVSAAAATRTWGTE